MALQHADCVLDWMANLSEEEMPPPWMWPFNEELAIHFENVRADRAARFGGESNDAGPMMENELARAWKN